MLDGVEPALPGVTVQVRISAADQLVVANPTATDLDVLGADGDLFLRIGPSGVLANLSSPTWYLSLNPEGGQVPPAASAAAAPRLVRVSREPSWGWFDRRLHPTTLTHAPSTTGRRAVRLSSWEVRMKYGSTNVFVTGHREFRPLLGAFKTIVTEQFPGASAVVFPGRLPAIYLHVSGAEEVTLLGAGGEPFARVGPRGADVNEASPSWVLTAEVRGTFNPVGPVDATAPPAWRHESDQPQLTWLEPRAMYSKDEPADATRAADLVAWSVPGTVGSRSVRLAGKTSWVPFRSGSSKSGGTSNGWRWPAAGGVAAAVVLVVAWVVRGKVTRTSTRHGGSQ